MIKLKSLLTETQYNIIDVVKNFLIQYYEYSSWNEFIDKQENGECQIIVSLIIHEFPQFKKYFGEIKIDKPYADEDGNEQNLVTHHWVILNNIPYDFSKGTLKNHIDFEDLYTVTLDEDKWRYYR